MIDVFFYLLGVVVGFTVCTILNERRKTIGNLRIDRSDPSEPPYVFLELTNVRDIESLEKRTDVLLKVVSENYIPQ